MTARREDRRRQHDSKSILKVFLISEELQVTNDIRFNGQRALEYKQRCLSLFCSVQNLIIGI